MSMPGIVIQIGANTKDAIDGINRVERALGRSLTPAEKANATFAKMGPALGAIAAAGAAVAIKVGIDAVQAFGDLNETLSKSSVVFGESSKAVQSWAQANGVALGLTEEAALDAATTFGTLGKAAGLAGPELSSFGTQFAGLAGDLASFSNTSVDEAITALGAGLRGEAEPLRKFGVLLDDATLKAAALEMGIYDGNGALSQQQKVMAASNVIMRQTRDAQGDAARTADSLANQTRQAAAAIGNLQVALGRGIVAGLGGTSKAGRTLVDTLEDMAPAAEWAGEAVGGLVAPLISIAGALGKASGAGVGFVKSLTGVDVAASDLAYGLNPLYWGLKIAGQGADQVSGALDNLRGEMAGTSRASEALTARLNAQATAAARASWASRQAAQAAATARANAAITDRYTAQARELGKTISFTGGNLQTYMAQLNAVTTATGGGGGGGGGGATGATDKASKAYDKLAASVAKTKDALTAAGEELEAAKAQFTDFTDAYGSWLSSGVSLKDALGQESSTAGTDAAVSWLDAFQTQLSDSRAAAGVLDALRGSLEAGNAAGNQALLSQLMTLPPGEAAKAAQQIIDQGIGPELARQLAEYDLWAGGAGAAWAEQFYGAGITAATSQYDAIVTTLEGKLEALYKMGKKMGDAVAQGFRDAVAGLPAGVNVPGRGRAAAGTYSQAPTVNVTVQAGIGDPIAIARTIEATLRQGRTRGGIL